MSFCSFFSISTASSELNPLPQNYSFFFFLNDTPPTEISPLPLHAPLPIFHRPDGVPGHAHVGQGRAALHASARGVRRGAPLRRNVAGLLRRNRHQADRRNRLHGDAAHLHRDRKSTRLNSSHSQISYAVFCL